MSDWAPLQDSLHDELRKGGDQAPCPRCGLKRVQRSDYIRCVRCGVNWINGEPLDRDPRAGRMRTLIEQIKATQTVKEKTTEKKT